MVRRITPKRVDRVSPVTGLPESFVGTVQAANVYLLKLPRLLAIAPVERKRRKPSSQPDLNKQNSENKKKEKRLSSQWREAVADAFCYKAILARRAKVGLLQKDNSISGLNARKRPQITKNDAREKHLNLNKLAAIAFFGLDGFGEVFVRIQSCTELIRWF